MLYARKRSFNTTYIQIVHMLYEKTFISIQHIYNLSICFMDKLSIFHIDKYMLDDIEKVHYEYIDIT